MQLEAGHVGQAEVEHHAVEAPSASASSASAPVPTAVVFDVAVADQLDDALPLRLVVLDHQQVA